jgi:hypothetical protein
MDVNTEKRISIEEALSLPFFVKTSPCIKTTQNTLSISSSIKRLMNMCH